LLYDFEKERMIVVSGKEAKELSLLYNLPARDLSLVRRHRIITTEDGVGTSYSLPSPADLALDEHEKALMKKDAAARSGVPHHVETCLAGYQNDWYGIERPFRNIGVPGALPTDDTADNGGSSEPTSPRTSLQGLTMPDHTARLNYLFMPPSSTFTVPRNPLHPVVYESGPNAEPIISESISLGGDDIEITETEDKDGTLSSEEPSMIEVGSSLEEERKYGGTVRHVRDRSASEAVQVNIQNLKEAALKEADPIDTQLLTPAEQGKTVIGVHRDLLFGQLYPLPDAPHSQHVVSPDVSSLGMRFKITPKDLSFAAGDLEPFFGTLALFDLASGERISENFYFDLNSDSTLSMLPEWHEAAQSSLDGKPGHVRSNVDALFWVPHASPDIWMVLRVEKVLQGDSYDNVIDPYMRPDAVKGKEREKMDSNISAFTSRLGGFRQPFCWGMLPIFTEDKQFAHGTGAVMKQLNRYKGDVSNAAFLEASADVKTGSKRLKWVPGSFTFDLAPVSETTIAAACSGNQPFVDWTGRVCTKFSGSDDENSNASHSGDDTAGSDEDNDYGSTAASTSTTGSGSGKSSKDKKPRKMRKERSSLSMTTKAMKLLGTSGASMGGAAIVATSMASHLLPFVPDYYPMGNYVQQVGCFPPPAVPFHTPHNVAFVYPSQLSISKTIGQTVARNLIVQVSLLCNEDDELSTALNSVFTRAHINPLATHAFSCVNYHDKSPVFYDEFKIGLPTRITKNHTLRFTFYHVQCQSKTSTPTGTGSGTAASLAVASAASASSVLTMIGYSVFPILNNDMIPEGEITLPIMSVGDGNGSMTSAQSNSASNSKNSMMDPKKASFTFRLKLSSSIYTSDKYLHPFFLEYGKGRISTKQAKASEEALKEAPLRVVSLTKALDGLTKVKPRKLLQFLPTVMHQLFHIMCSQPIPISNKAFHTLVQVLHNIHQKESEMQVPSLSNVLQHYIDYLFMSPPNIAPLNESGGVTFQDAKAPASIVNSLYPQITRAWCTLVHDTAKNDHEKLHRFSWFYFKLIYLSGASYTLDLTTSSLKDAPAKDNLEEIATNNLLAAAASPASIPSTPDSSPSKDPGATSPRSDSDDASKDSRERISRFTAENKVALKKLVLLLAWEVQERLNVSLQLAKELSRKIAAFLVDMLSIADRGFIIDLALRALKEIAPREDETCWELRADFWKIFSSYEHWTQLALPTTLHIDSKNVGHLEDLLAQKHFLQGALMRDLVFSPMSDKTSRLRGLHIIQSLFMKADLDPRLNPAIMSSIRLSQDGKPPLVVDFPPIELDDAILSSGSGDKRSSRRGSHSSRRSGSLSLRSKRAGIQHMALSDPTTSNLKTQYLQGFFPLLLRGVDQLEALKRADYDEQRVFLSCWIYLIKNIDVRLLRQWWKTDSFTRNSGFLQTLSLCAQVFEYQGYVPLIQKLAFTSEVTTRAVATKALIEELYAEGGASASPNLSLRQRRMENLKLKGTNAGTLNASGSASGGAGSSGMNPGQQDALLSARGQSSLSVAAGQTMVAQLREDAASASSGAPGSGKLRNRKHRRGQVTDVKDLKWRHAGLDSERGRYDSNPVRESRISHEVSVVILDCLEWYMVAKESDLNTNAQSNLLMDGTVGVLMSLLSRRQGIDLQILILRVFTAYAHTFSKPLFVLSSSYIAQFMPRILALCNYENERVRMGASAFFFLMMKLNLENSPAKHRNFTRVKVQAIIALSKLVAGQAGIRDLSFLNRALNGVQAYANQYNTASGTNSANALATTTTTTATTTEAKDDASVENAFLVQQVSRLSARLRAIMEGSVKIQQHAGDTDMLTDLYHQIASSYRTAPDLRVTWLESLAELHARNNAWAEAGQCLVHIAALISEYLQILEPTEGSMKGAAAFEAACVSAVEEQSMLDAQHMMDEDGVGETHIFTEKGLCDVVERAIAYLTKAQLYESAHELYKLLLPVHEKAHDYAKLSASHAALSNIFNKIVESINNQSRLFGSYYRVGFYGARYGDLNGKEFVYKEPKITRLGEIQDRLMTLYSRKLGTTITMITTSGDVEVKKLEPDNCYMQLTHVSPYFDDWELKQRKTDYERNNNIGRFIFETPFVKGSTKSQSPQLVEQWKRKTILTVEAAFPYMKRRLPVVNKEAVELSPIETAIEAIEGRVHSLSAQLEYPNAKTLPLVLQGSVRSAVNAGPTEISKVFLAPGCDKTFGPIFCDRLRIVLQSFLDICQEALAKNKEIIASAQLNFHQELEEGYIATKAVIEPMLVGDSK
jgi:hypothetical protein